jgi:hypothetical protein
MTSLGIAMNFLFNHFEMDHFVQCKMRHLSSYLFSCKSVSQKGMGGRFLPREFWLDIRDLTLYDLMEHCGTLYE